MRSMGLDGMITAWVPSVAFLGGGFFLMAVGVPISSLAMFSFAAAAMRAERWPWAYTALLVGFFTAAGHVSSYAVFRAAGRHLMDTLARRLPSLSRVLAYLKASASRGRPRAVLGLFALRWVGVGYSQVFWVLGALGDDGERTLRALVVTDVIWAATWSWALARIVADVPKLGQYMALAGWVLLGVGVLAVSVREAVRWLGRRSGRRRR
ncbi:MAG TPA: hypothetical protein GX515_05180 [Firmicutes bacterium]|nr:hypothetical protein [Bacillota bacterium]